jgi:hypothetical protein
VPGVSPLTIRKPSPLVVTAWQKNVAVVAGQLPWYSAKLGEVWPAVATLRALLKRKIMDEELAVNWYHRSSSGAATQVVPGVDGVAVSVLALTEAEQATPKGTVVITVAPVHSSFAGCAAALRKHATNNMSRGKILLYIV